MIEAHIELMVIMLALCTTVFSIVGIIKLLVRFGLICSKKNPQELAEIKSNLNTVMYISGWGTLSVSFTVFNKWFMNVFDDGRGFQFPFVITSMHMLAKVFFSRVVTHHKGVVVSPLPWGTYIAIVAPIGMSSALDIALSNYAFRTISVSAYTIIKSANVIFVFFIGNWMGLENNSWWILISVTCIIGGFVIALSAYIEDTEFWGMTSCITATMLAAVRWTFTQYLIENDPASSNPLIVLYRIAAAGFITMLPIFFSTEYERIVQYVYHEPWETFSVAFGFMAAGGVMSCVLILVEIKILSMTSSLTFAVLGAGKEIIQITLACIVLQDDISATKILGIAIAMISVVWYNHLKASQNESINKQRPKGGKGGLNQRNTRHSHGSSREQEYRQLARNDIDHVFNSSTALDDNFDDFGEFDDIDSENGLL